MSGQRHVPTALPRERNQISKEQEAGSAQSRSRFGGDKNRMSLPRFEQWIVQTIAQSLHRLHLIGSQLSVLVPLFVTGLRPHFKRKHSHRTDTYGRKYTRTSRGIYEASVTLTTKTVTVRVPGQVHHAPNPEDQVIL
jgi:hypothetical protein